LQRTSSGYRTCCCTTGARIKERSHRSISSHLTVQSVNLPELIFHLTLTLTLNLTLTPNHNPNSGELTDKNPFQFSSDEVSTNTPVWRNGRAFARDPKGRGFESRPVRFQITTTGKLLTHACASVTKQNKLVPTGRRAVTLFDWKGNRSLTKNDGSLPPGGYLKVTCGLTACRDLHWDQLQAQRSVTSTEELYLLYITNTAIDSGHVALSVTCDN